MPAYSLFFSPSLLYKYLEIAMQLMGLLRCVCIQMSTRGFTLLLSVHGILVERRNTRIDVYLKQKKIDSRAARFVM